MIQITPQMRILVAVEPTDFRRGIDYLAAGGRTLPRRGSRPGEEHKTVSRIHYPYI